MSGKNKSEKNATVLKQLSLLKEEHKDATILMHLEGTPKIKITITTTYSELYKELEGLTDFYSKLKTNEKIDDLILKPEMEFGHFYGTEEDGCIGIMLYATRGIMITLPVEQAADIFGEMALNKTTIYKRKMPE
ncbi:hypothetical protein MQH19_001123 [Escherichia coli]|nr:hypothetical protein [Escherichia coli]EEZ2511875.1 hypothetical protein [Escherichia coli]EFA6039829.1 hypothetical protein [Escherichia coli]EFL5589190.1 hypothetical protein [Escherichia coli]EIZ6920044.1 hypothetical protein [Escherichia coli]